MIVRVDQSWVVFDTEIILASFAQLCIVGQVRLETNFVLTDTGKNRRTWD